MFFKARNQFRRDILAFICSAPGVEVGGAVRHIRLRSVQFGRSFLNDIVNVTYYLTDEPLPVDPATLAAGGTVPKVGTVRSIYGGGFSTWDGLEGAKRIFLDAVVRKAAT